jgi:hypothetical protein
MTATITYVRFGNLTKCYSCGEPFRSQHPRILVCGDCLGDAGQALVQDTLKSIEFVELDD